MKGHNSKFNGTKINGEQEAMAEIAETISQNMKGDPTTSNGPIGQTIGIAIKQMIDNGKISILEILTNAILGEIAMIIGIIIINTTAPGPIIEIDTRTSLPQAWSLQTTLQSLT
jgi:hypothetical protein